MCLCVCHEGVCVSVIRVSVCVIRGVCVCIFYQGVSCGCVFVCDDGMCVLVIRVCVCVSH